MKLAAMIALTAADKIPAGWLTIEQLARAEDSFPGGSFRRTVREAVRLGLLERREFRVYSVNQRRSVPHYKRLK